MKFCFSQCGLDCVTKICSRGSCDVSIMLVEKPVSSMGHLQGKHAGPLRHQRLACYLERKYYFSVYSVLVKENRIAVVNVWHPSSQLSQFLWTQPS